MGEKPDNMKRTTKKISAEQRSALEAAGYKVNRSGTSVQDKDGGTVGGFNENGQISSGSSKVTAILKSSPKPAMPATAKPASKIASAPPKRPTTPKPSVTGSAKGSAGAPSKTTANVNIRPKEVKTPSVAGRIGAAIGGFEGRQRKPVTFPESKGTTNPISRASSAVGKALGSVAAKLATGRGPVAKAPNRMEAFKLQQKKK